MTTIIARSAESVHWYGKDGSPQYTVKAKDGSDRPTTLRDARKLDLVPSVTTILKVAAKPGLEAWKLEQMLLSALTLPRTQNEQEKDFIARIVADSKETAKQAAERGTRIHESVEKWLSGNHDVEHPVIAKSVEDSINEYFGKQEWITEASFANYGYGGKVDIYSKDGEYGVILDVKSKEFGPDDEVKAYDEHLIQLAAYANGLDIRFPRCANVFVSSTSQGLVDIFEWSIEDVNRGVNMFNHLKEFWYLKNKLGGEK